MRLCFLARQDEKEPRAGVFRTQGADTGSKPAPCHWLEAYWCTIDQAEACFSGPEAFPGNEALQSKG